MPNEPNERSKIKIESRILISLLDDSKTTGQIARELGYIDEAGKPLYNYVLPPLRRLERKGILSSYKLGVGVGVGAPPTLWMININEDTLKKLVNDYPECIPNMQRNELIIEFICANHIDHFPEESRKIWRDLFKEMVKSSPNFLKILVNKTIQELIDIFHDLPYVSFKFPEVVRKGDDIDFSLEEGELLVFPTLYEYIYWICVGEDLIEYGKSQQSLQALTLLNKIEEYGQRRKMFLEASKLIRLVAKIAKLIELNSLPSEEIVRCIEEFSQSYDRLKAIEDQEKQREEFYNLFIKTKSKIDGILTNALIEKGFKDEDIVNLPYKFSKFRLYY